MSRSAFIKLCLKTLKEITPSFINEWKRLGISADYDICYSTIDDNSRKISQKHFIDLYLKSEVEKKGFPTLWCPECQTAIAQAELEDKERTTELVYIKGEIGEKEYIIYATTRPELHPACVGISIDKNGSYIRAKKGEEVWIVSRDAMENFGKEFGLETIELIKGRKLVGREVKIAFAKKSVEVSHDDSAKTEYGTGVVYYCSYGGVDCVQWLGRHPEVEAVHVMGEDGRYTEEPVRGLRSPEARKKIVELLEKKGLLVKREKMKHFVNTHDKCGTDVEFISTPQWFIKIMDKKDRLIEQGDKIRWYPEHMQKRYDTWIRGLEWDWNISRNRHFGIPIPAWHCENCDKVILANDDELPIDPLQKEKKCLDCGKIATPEKMVLDTWATSSLTPIIASSIAGTKIGLPFSLRPQAHDIIRTWAFYTITRAFMERKEIPWEDIMISGNVSLKGEKMSKSKGNVIEPKEVLKKYGADALRFWAAGSKLGGDLDYQEQDLIAGKKTVTKLWNASKFVFMNLEDWKGKKPKKRNMIDSQFEEKLNGLIKICTDAFENYEYSRAKMELEKFFWKDFCDNYLEIVKKRVYEGDGDERLSAQDTLYSSLLNLLKLFAPIMPFITEEVYQTYFRKREKEKSIHLFKWPGIEGRIGGKKFDDFVDLLAKVRQEKTAAKKSMNSEVIISLKKSDLEGMMGDFKNVTSAKEIREGKFKVEFV